MTILAIDTTNELLGVALSKDGNLIAELMTNIKKDHSERLMPAIVELMEKGAVDVEALEKIVVARGPGSYTGVRIGITTAKTMAWSLDIPIVPVSSLAALALNGAYFNGHIWPFFDARRQAMYTGLYRYEAGKLVEVMKEQYVSFTAWMQQIENLIEETDKVLCISPHLARFEPLIREQLGERVVFPMPAIHLLRPANLIELSKNYEAIPVHAVKPNYLRITEAEANLQKQEEKRVENDG